MKTIKLLLFTVIGLLPMTSIAQTINNAGMEQWDTTGNYADPKGYSSSNTLLSTIPGNSVYTLSPSSDVHGGKYAALLQSKYYLQLGNTIPGLLTNGKLKLDSSNGNGLPVFTGGQAFSKRITHLSFWYKHFPVSHDSMIASAYLLKYNKTLHRRDTIAYARYTDTMKVSIYTQKTLNFTYKSNAYPDTMLLIIASSSLDGGHSGSKVYIDDISADSLKSGIASQEIINAGISVYPNPSRGYIEISRPSSNYPADIHIADITGRILLQAHLAVNQNQIKLITSQLSTGAYIVHLLENGKVFATKVVVEDK